MAGLRAMGKKGLACEGYYGFGDYLFCYPERCHDTTFEKRSTRMQSCWMSSGKKLFTSETLFLHYPIICTSRLDLCSLLIY